MEKQPAAKLLMLQCGGFLCQLLYTLVHNLAREFQPAHLLLHHKNCALACTNTRMSWVWWASEVSLFSYTSFLLSHRLQCMHFLTVQFAHFSTYHLFELPSICSSHMYCRLFRCLHNCTLVCLHTLVGSWTVALIALSLRFGWCILPFKAKWLQKTNDA